ncbi:MAG: hypothetical protein AB8G22_09960 [Saprospiraceae bacterium]
MNSETFISFINDNSKLYQLPYEELKSLVMRYPWCQHLRVLLLKKSKQDGHADYERNLHLAAMHSVNRTHLYRQLQQADMLEESEDAFLLQDEFLELKNLTEVERTAEPELIELKVDSNNLEDILLAELDTENAPIPTEQTTVESKSSPLELDEDEEDILLGSILTAAASAELTAKINEPTPDISVENLQTVEGDLDNLDIEAITDDIELTEENTTDLLGNGSEVIDLDDLINDIEIATDIEKTPVVYESEDEAAPAETIITGAGNDSSIEHHLPSQDEEVELVEVDELEDLTEEVKGGRPEEQFTIIEEELDVDKNASLDEIFEDSNLDSSEQADARGDNGDQIIENNNLAQDLDKEESIGEIPETSLVEITSTSEAANIEENLDAEVEELLNEFSLAEETTNTEVEPAEVGVFGDSIDDLLTPTTHQAANNLLDDLEADFTSANKEIPLEITNQLTKDNDLVEPELPIVDVSAIVPDSELVITDQAKNDSPKAKVKKKKKKKKKKKDSEAKRVARESLEEDEEIGSELLAEILIMQGNYEKAIAMYERLSLANPEKSAYFAAKIAELDDDEEE